MTRFLDSTASFSPCGAYRYDLTRVWDCDKPLCMFLMLNPSTATAEVLDPTIRRCIGFARSWDCGSLVVCNLFALRSTDPRELYKSADPIGPDNDAAIERWARKASLRIAAWGNHGQHRERGVRVKLRLRDLGVPLSYLRLTNAGNPAHPLSRGKGFIPADTLPTPLPVLEAQR